jgi:glycine/D-amino acid oxidase-like deaminating enzyme
MQARSIQSSRSSRSRRRHSRRRSVARCGDEEGCDAPLCSPPLPLVPWWTDLAPGILDELWLLAYASSSPFPVDVAVIGGGVAGLSAALSARQAGAEVVVLEREALLGYGATGRNAGILSAGINMGLADLEPGSAGAAFWPATTAALLALVEEAKRPGSVLSATLTGALSLAESANAARHLTRETQVRIAAGLRAELWTPAQVAAYTQGRLNTATVVQAMWLPDEGRIHPLTLLAHLARQARAAGVQLFGQATVTGYEEEAIEGRASCWRLTLANGASMKARGLIQCVGPTARPNARIYALAFSAGLPDTFPLFWDASPYTYADYRPGNGRLTVSGGRYGKAGMTRRDAAYYQRLADGARRWLPELAHQSSIYQWAVDLDVTSAMVPGVRILGSVAPGRVIEGLGALGVLPGIVLGRRVGKEIAMQLS